MSSPNIIISLPQIYVSPAVGTFKQKNGKWIHITSRGKRYSSAMEVMQQMMRDMLQQGMQQGFQQGRELQYTQDQLMMLEMFQQGMQQGFKQGRENQYSIDQLAMETLENDRAHLVSENHRLSDMLSSLLALRSIQPQHSSAAETLRDSVPPAQTEHAEKPMIIEHNETGLNLDLDKLEDETLFHYFLSESCGSITASATIRVMEYTIENPSKFFAFFVRLYSLDQEAVLLLNAPLKGKREILRQALLTVLKNDRQNVFFAATKLRTALPGKEWKGIKQEIDKSIRMQCPTVKSCVEYGLPELANSYVARAIKAHEPGKENCELIGDLSLLLLFDSTLLLVRDRVQELHQKDPILLKACETILTELTFRIHKEKPDYFDEWCAFVLSINNLSCLFMTGLSLMFVQEQIKRPITRFIAPSFMTHWAARRGADEIRAFWLTLGDLRLDSERNFKVLMTQALALESPPKSETSEENRQRLQRSIIKFLHAWGTAPKEWNLPPLGNLYKDLWELVSTETLPTDRLALLHALWNGMRRGPFSYDQVVIFIDSVLKEMGNNPEFNDTLKEQYILCCYSLLVLCKQNHDHPSVHQGIADIAGKLWQVIRGSPSIQYQYFTDKRKSLEIENFMKFLRAQHQTEKEFLETIAFFEKAHLLYTYFGVIKKLTKSYENQLSKQFTKQCIDALSARMDGPFGTLIAVKACAAGRVIFAQQLLNEWTAPLSLAQFKEVFLVKNIKNPQDSDFIDDPFIVQERQQLQSLIVHAAVTSSDEIWNYFESHLDSLWFNDLYKASQAGVKGQVLKDLARKIHLNADPA